MVLCSSAGVGGIVERANCGSPTRVGSSAYARDSTCIGSNAACISPSGRAAAATARSSGCCAQSAPSSRGARTAGDSEITFGATR